MSNDQAALEDEAIRKISEAMRLLNEKRWSKASQAQKNAQGRKMRAGLKKAKKAKGV